MLLMVKKIKIIIVDDHPMFRQGIKLYFQSNSNIKLIGEADNGENALKLIEQKGKNVDIVLMDLKMPNMDGIELTKKLKEDWPDLKVLALTSFNSWEKVYNVLKAGASGYVLKDSKPDELLAAIKAVAVGGSYFGNGIAKELLNRVEEEKKEELIKESFEKLTKRELEVLKLIAKGLGNKEIAEKLMVSEKTVKTHTANIYPKLNVHSRTQAAIYAVKNGLI